jgi:hypothetical protein
MAIKYVEVRTQKWDTWLVKLDDSEFTTEEAQRDAAYEAVEEEMEFDEAEFRFPTPEADLKYSKDNMEAYYARHEGKDHVIDWTQS